MWTKEITDMIVSGVWATLYMTHASTMLGYIFGLPMGVPLAITDLSLIHIYKRLTNAKVYEAKQTKAVTDKDKTEYVSNKVTATDLKANTCLLYTSRCV